MRFIVSFALLAFPLLLDAQSPAAAQPAFEIASIKLDNACGNGRGRRVNEPTPGRFDLSCVRVRKLIEVAYGGFVNGALSASRIQVLGGPPWIDTDYYDLSAKAAGLAPFNVMAGPMLQALLEDRLQVKVHREPRDFPVYSLSIAKSGLKLTPSKDGSCTPIDLNNPRRQAMEARAQPPKYCGTGSSKGVEGNLSVDWYSVTMAELAGRTLVNYVDRPVIDNTGLTGRFDVHLEFSRDNLGQGTTRLNGVDVPSSPDAPDAAGPSIFTAVQKQLGLKLTPDKGPIEVIVVDRVEKPSEN